MMRRFLAALAGFALTVPSVAQDMDEADNKVMNAAWKAQRDGRLLDADQVLRSRAFDANGKPRDGIAYSQWQELQGVLTGIPSERLGTPAPIDPNAPGVKQIATAEPRDAVAAIVERARKTRVVVLNESHGSPRSRAFGLEVARALRPLGYDLLSVETFNNDADPAKAAALMAKLEADGYARRTTGYYTRDPVFADFIRQALALGYRPFAHEETDHGTEGGWPARIARRETAQADFIAKMLAANPRSKALVFVGFSHATEEPVPSAEGEPTRWMATRLKAMTGIDPLTIDQTTLNERTGSAGLYALVRPKLGTRSVTLFNGDTALVVGNYRGLLDLQVAHPPLKVVDGRPDWLTMMNRKPTAIPAQYLPTKGTRLVQAYIASEADDAIPIDQMLVTAGQTPPKLYLPNVPVRYVVQDPTPTP
ncbi:hypothetical protein [uncultured Sphingomonas sp.]|uniref:hypothetical protein n=1 Tax=uncultured Sphingomonas sp. TaxID=158754 RepID=UPI0025CCFABF|nr:hypothetical protein [uncultured Sphingomonas sp.]